MEQWTIGMIGLGKMGRNLALNMQEQGVGVIGYDPAPGAVQQARSEGLRTVENWEELFQSLGEKRVFWMMVPAGPAVDRVLEDLGEKIRPGDIVIDGGNSRVNETERRHRLLASQDVPYLDVGTSGGMDGARNGACMMVGGPRDAYDALENIFRKICVPGGVDYFGPSGSGHYIKMIHNGIEYGMLQAMAEGFEIIEASGREFDLAGVARVWSNGSVIRGWLMELMEEAFREDPGLESIGDRVDASGEGLWTVQEALEQHVPAPVITEALYARFRSQKSPSFAGKVVAALRRGFGGHAVYGKKERS